MAHRDSIQTTSDYYVVQVGARKIQVTD